MYTTTKLITLQKALHSISYAKCAQTLSLNYTITHDSKPIIQFS